MALSDVVLPPASTRRQCSVCAVFDGRDDGEWQQVTAWKAQGHTWVTIASAITREYGFTIRHHALSRHARGLCVDGPR